VIYLPILLIKSEQRFPLLNSNLGPILSKPLASILIGHYTLNTLIYLLICGEVKKVNLVVYPTLNK
jgi:hypothetical protein